MAMSAREHENDSRLPVYYQLRDRLAAWITAGKWSIDEALPSENQLARSEHLAVGTVRKAMQLLVDEGLVERRRGSGTYLRRPAFNASLFRFFALKLDETGQAVPQSHLISRSRETANDAAAEAIGTTDAIRVQRLRSHLDQVILAEDIWIPATLFSGFEDVDEVEIGPLLYPFYFDRYTVLVAYAQDEVSFDIADAETAQRLGLAPGDPIAVIERTAFAPDNTPVEWRVARGPAHRFRYQSRIG